MKNNLIYKFLILFVLFICFFNANSEELKFEASSIEIIDKDRIIIANDGVKILSGNEITIDADQMRYDKEKKFLKAKGNIVVRNQIENIEIKSDNISYDKKNEKIISSGNVVVIFENNY